MSGGRVGQDDRVARAFDDHVIRTRWQNILAFGIEDSEYGGRRVQDDTGTFLRLARAKIDAEPAHAASLAIGVIGERIRLYVQRHQPAVR